MKQFLVPFGLKPKKIDDGPRYADANDRCFAAVIDVVILFMLLSSVSVRITNAVYKAFHQLQPLASTRIENFQQLGQLLWETRYPWLVSNGLIFLMMGVCIVICQMLYETTPGKWVLGLKIVRAGTLARIPRWRYVLRFFGYIPAVVPFMIGIIWISFNKQRRGWQDYIAGTVVINTRPRGWYFAQVKNGFRWLKRKLTGSPAMEEPVGEPAAGERHQDTEKPVD